MAAVLMTANPINTYPNLDACLVVTISSPSNSHFDNQ